MICSTKLTFYKLHDIGVFFPFVDTESCENLSRIFNIMVSPVLAGAEQTDVQFSCGVIDRGVEAYDMCKK